MAMVLIVLEAMTMTMNDNMTARRPNLNLIPMQRLMMIKMTALLGSAEDDNENETYDAEDDDYDGDNDDDPMMVVMMV